MKESDKGKISVAGVRSSKKNKVSRVHSGGRKLQEK